MFRMLPAAPMLGALVLVACAAPSPFQAHMQGCAAAHPAGSQGFAYCMSSAMAEEPSDEVRERRRWLARLAREQVEAEARVRRERALANLNRQ